MKVIFDDIGSFPLPKSITRSWVSDNINSKEYDELVQRTFLLKARVVQCPNYPQFQDMVEQFISIIRNPSCQEDAYLVSREYAVIREVEAIKAMNYSGNTRVCVTGPFELYYREFGGVIYDDILENIAISLSRFAANAMSLNVCSLSIDEPSLGINPELQPSVEQLRLAYSPFSFDADIQIHLHSPLYYTKLLDIEEIDIFGVEAARDEKALEFIDEEELLSAEKRIRVGVARSDIDAIVAEFNAKHNVNAWKDSELCIKAVDEIENVEIIKKRIERAYERFGDVLAYVGPDCGLFSFPTQESALKLLENVRRALEVLGWSP